MDPQMDLEKVNQVWTEALTKAAKEMTLALITGTEPPKVEVHVTMEIPKPFYDCIKTACIGTNIDFLQVFGQMAGAGFQRAMVDKLKIQASNPFDMVSNKMTCESIMPTSSQQGNQLTPQLNIGNLQKQITDMQKLMSQVMGLQEQVQHAQSLFDGTDPLTKGAKNFK